MQVIDLRLHIQMPMLPQYRELYDQNPEVAGWIQIEGTKLNCPVMQSRDDPERYLRLNFEGKYAYSGLPFLDARNDAYSRTENLIVYGHNMKNGTIFGQIPNYADKKYWENNPIVKFDLLAERREYEVIGMFRSHEYREGEAGFRYYDYIDLDRDSFDEYVTQVKQASLYDTGITPKWGDELLTLSTCSYHVDKGTFVLVCRRVL
jgi:sortase B